MAKTTDPTRSSSTQPYRTTRAAQRIARTTGPRTHYAQLPEPQVPTYRPNAAYVDRFRRAVLAGHTTQEAARIARALADLRPLAEVLSPRTLATLNAIEKGGRQ